MNTYGLDKDTITDAQVQAAAQTCHEVNRAYVLATSRKVPVVFAGTTPDPATQPWESLDADTVASAVDGVRFHIANPEATPEDSHANWLKTKKAQGWTYGRVKNADLKQSPCMVAYDQLPLEQRVKDSLFMAALENALRLLDFARNNQ